MTDLEITKACAEAMGYAVHDDFAELSPPVQGIEVRVDYLDTDGWNRHSFFRYSPLTDDAQAMALVKKFELTIKWSWAHQCGVYGKPQNDDPLPDDCPHTDLNRAICEFVAKVRNG